MTGMYELLDRSPPSDTQIEESLLGSIILLPDCLDDVATIVRPEDFYDDANQRLFRAMSERHMEGKKLDIALLIDYLKKTGEFETIGGAAYLFRVSQSVPNAAHAKFYAKAVREKAVFRRLIEVGSEMCRAGFEAYGDAKDALADAERAVSEIADSTSDAQTSDIRDMLNQAMDRLDSRLRGETVAGTIQTGFTDLDALTGGMHAAEMVIVAGRPSMGKTSFATNIAEHVAIDQGKAVLIVSLESSAIELTDRLLCSSAEVNAHRLRNATLSQHDRGRLVEAAARLSQSQVFIEDSPARSVTDIASIARRTSRRSKQPLALIVIDYLQMIEPDNPKDSRQEQVAKISRRLKQLARDMKCPVVCLAQLNRAAEDSKDHRPRLSHLRESGAIEQDADVVMLVHREEYFLRGEAAAAVAGQATIIVAKQRNGPTDDVELYWDAACMRFRNPAPKRREYEAPAETRAARERKDLF